MLFPLALLYGAIIGIRNLLYDRKVFNSTRFSMPVISVGNLTVGGTGKTPHIEYLVNMLVPDLHLATLSRGYGRTKSGFILANEESTALDIGDEPMQYYLKHPNLRVAVGENRLLAVPDIMLHHPETQLILMDDAFQHRRVRPGLSILLTEYSKPFTRDRILPLGRLRESAASYHRADIIVVTKCPLDISEEEKSALRKEIAPYPYQKLYFSTMSYGQPYDMLQPELKLDWFKDAFVLLVTGIAQPEALKEYVESKVDWVHHLKYRDHHQFDRYDLENIKEAFMNIDAERKIIITTEKDATRLRLHGEWLDNMGLHVFCLPIAVQFLGADKHRFEGDILHYLNVTLQQYEQHD